MGRRLLFILVASSALAGCASFDPARDNVAIEKLLADRGSPSLGWDRNGSAESDPLIRSWLEQPMTADLAVKAVMLKSLRLQQVYGELGLARADVLEAIQISNPRTGLSSLALANGPGSQFTFGIAAPLIDLITLPAKARLARLDTIAHESIRPQTSNAQCLHHANSLKQAEVHLGGT